MSYANLNRPSYHAPATAAFPTARTPATSATDKMAAFSIDNFFGVDFALF
jgi:hypothetical protein